MVGEGLFLGAGEGEEAVDAGVDGVFGFDELGGEGVVLGLPGGEGGFPVGAVGDGEAATGAGDEGEWGWQI